VHDYEADPSVLRSRYHARFPAEGIGPAGRRMSVAGEFGPSVPLMLTEFGGIKYARGSSSWGYSVASSPSEFEAQLRAIYEALRASPFLAGTCYTQLTDTMQEANGLVTADRKPKLDIAVIRSIVAGS
jgi:hypothetical protein